MEYLPIKTLYIEVTHACNQHCKHCYLNGGVQNATMQMSTEQIKKILREFKNQDGRYIILTGGEPIMRSDIFEILDYIEELKIPFSFASNSLAMTRKRLEKLASYKQLHMYFTSILGADEEKHKAIAERDSFHQVFEALDFFEKRKVATYVQVTLADAYVDDMEMIVEKLTNYNYCTIKITPIATFGVKTKEEADKNQQLLVAEEKFSYFHSKVSALQKKYPGKIENSNIQNHKQILSVIADYEEEELYSMCYGFIAVRPNGDISFSCNMDNPFVFGKAYESIKIPVDEKLKNYIEILRKAERLTLEEAEAGIVEFDVTVDKYINLLQ